MARSTATDFDVIIPARYGSVRLPGKPLIEIAGKPLIVHAMLSARQSQAERVVVATDDQRIVAAVDAAGGEAMMTATDHPSGTDRIAEVADRLALGDERIVVNVQGDEPDMPGALIDQVARTLVANPVAVMATAGTPITCWDEFVSPDNVKVVVNDRGLAHYFSRAPIPWPRAGAGARQPPPSARRHVGIYAYRVRFLREFVGRPQSMNEQLESLEQLRSLDAGEKIAVVDAVATPGAGIDSPADLAAFREHMSDSSPD